MQQHWLRCLIFTVIGMTAIYANAQPQQNAEPAQNDTQLLVEEEIDARRSEQAELQSREQALKAQQATTEQLLEQQEAYLNALRAELKRQQQHAHDGDTTRE